MLQRTLYRQMSDWPYMGTCFELQGPSRAWYKLKKSWTAKVILITLFSKLPESNTVVSGVVMVAYVLSTLFTTTDQVHFALQARRAPLTPRLATRLPSRRRKRLPAPL